MNRTMTSRRSGDGTAAYRRTVGGKAMKTTRRRRVWLGAALLSALMLVMQAASVSADTQITVNPNVAFVLCQTMQCISGVQVTPHGQFANISFHTSVANFATVQVSTVPPKKQADGTFSYSGIAVDSFALTP